MQSINCSSFSNFQVDKNSERPSSLNLNRVKNDPKMSHIKFSLRTLDLQKIGQAIELQFHP